MSLQTNIIGPDGEIAKVENERLLVQLPGPQPTVPAEIDNQVHSYETFIIGNKGASNRIYYKPCFQSENVAAHEDIVLTLSGNSPAYGMQIFRARADNVNTVAITTKANPVTTLRSNFGTGETWTSSTPSKISVAFDTTTGNYNNYDLDTNNSSLKLTFGNNVTGTTVTRTVTQNWSTDVSAVFGFKATTFLNMSLRLSDGTNSSTWNFSNTQVNVWELKTIDLTTPSSSSGILNFAAITSIILLCNTTGNLTGQFAWIDGLEAQAAPGNLNLQLWDFGTNKYPNNFNLGTQLVLDDGNSQLQVPNPVVKTTQRVALKYGISDRTKRLKIGNYYGLVFYNNSSGNISIFGNGQDEVYSHGGVFQSNTQTTINRISNKSVYFCF